MSIIIKDKNIYIESSGTYINGFKLIKKPIPKELIKNLKKEKNNRYSGITKTTLKMDKNINQQKFIGSNNLSLHFEKNTLTICSPTPEQKHLKLIKKHKIKINYNINIIDQNANLKKVIKVTPFTKKECYSSKLLTEKTSKPFSNSMPYFIKVFLIIALYLLSIFGVYKCLK